MVLVLRGQIIFIIGDVLIAIATAERFRDKFVANVSEIKEGHSESFFMRTLLKNIQNTEVFARRC